MSHQFPTRNNGPDKRAEVEIGGYRSLLPEDAIPNLQRILASIANSLLSVRYAAWILA